MTSNGNRTPRPSRSPSPAQVDGPLLHSPRGGLLRLLSGSGGRRARLTAALLVTFSVFGLCLLLASAPHTEPGLLASRRGTVAGGGDDPTAVAGQGEAPVTGEAPAEVPEAPQAPPSTETLKALWMTPEEAASMLDVMRKDMVYLEYGSGGSTMAFAPMAKRAYSVEHDEEWCGRMQEKLVSSGLSQRVTYTCTPVARGTGGWGVGYAFEEGTYRVFKPYVDVVTTLNETTFDVVLIDGRARVACALKVLPYLNDDSLVLLHDARREKYLPILEYYDPLGEVVGTYGVRLLRRKRGIEALLPLPDSVIHAAYGEESTPVPAEGAA